MLKQQDYKNINKNRQNIQSKMCSFPQNIKNIQKVLEFIGKINYSKVTKTIKLKIFDL